MTTGLITWLPTSRPCGMLFMKMALSSGGYTTWGCIDLVSGRDRRNEEALRFYLCRPGQRRQGSLDRSRKKSFYWYKEVIATNGASVE